MSRRAIAFALLLIPSLALAAGDPLLAWTNKNHDPSRQEPFTRRVRASLPTAAGVAGVIGYSNTEKASHASWATAWYLRTPSGKLFEILDVTDPGGAIEAGEVDGHPAVVLLTGDMHQGEGYNARTSVYAAGSEYRFRRETTRFSDVAEPSSYEPAQIEEGKLGLKPVPASIARAVPAGGTYPKAPPPSGR